MSTVGTATGAARRRRLTLAALALAIACEAAFAQAVVSWGDVRHLPGVDLRARVVGTRMALAGQDPYFGRQDPTAPDELWDPLRPATVSRCTYSPAVLLFYAPLASVRYRVQRLAWAALEWLALGLSVVCLGFCLTRRSDRAIWLVAAALLFVATNFWRIHVERGQYYVFVLAAWSLAWWLVQRWPGRSGETLAGGALGVAIAFRPTAIVMLAPLLLLRQRRVAVVSLVSAAFVVGVSAAFFGLGSWSQFFRAGAVWERAVIGIDSLSTPFVERAVADGYRLTRVLPSGMDNTAIAGWLGDIRPLTLATARTARLAFGALLAGVIALVTLRHRGRARASQRRQAFLAAFSLAVLADLALPVRYGYADVLWLAPLALALPLWSRGVGLPSAAFVLLGLLLGRGDLGIPRISSGVLPFALVSTGFLCLVLAVGARRRSLA
jgi:hypothetical protein